MKVLFKNVKWDTDGASIDSCGLKSSFQANIPVNINTGIDEIENILSDWLSDEFGYCHTGFDYEII